MTGGSVGYLPDDRTRRHEREGCYWVVTVAPVAPFLDVVHMRSVSCLHLKHGRCSAGSCFLFSSNLQLSQDPADREAQHIDQALDPLHCQEAIFHIERVNPVSADIFSAPTRVRAVRQHFILTRYILL